MKTRLLLSAGAFMFLLMYTTSCKENKYRYELTEGVTCININNPTKLPDNFITDYKIIPLETTDDCLISSIHQLYVTDSLFYILDTSERKIQIFNQQGKYLKTIDNQGQGPNEYIAINSFSIDPYNGRLLLSDSFSKRIFIYDLSGNFLSTVQLDFTPIEIAGKTDGGFANLYAGSNRDYNDKEMESHHIHLLDSTGTVTRVLIDDETPNVINLRSAAAINYLPDNSILYNPMLSDTIYRVDLSGHFAPQYVLCNHSSFKLPDKEKRAQIGYTYEKPEPYIECEKQGYLLSCGGMINADHQMLFAFGWDKLVYLFYSKKTGQSLTAFAETIENGDDETSRVMLGLFPKTSHEDWFYTSIDAITAGMIAPELKDTLLQKQLQHIDADDNPAIIRYKMNF